MTEETAKQTKLCKKCRTEIDAKAKVCPQCRSKQGGKLLPIIGALLLLFVLIGALGSGDSEEGKPASDNTTTQSQETTSSETTQVNTSEESKSVTDPLLLSWNKTDINAMSNGNISVAVEALSLAQSSVGNSVSEQPQKVIKAPWNYYGKFIKFTGLVAVVQDFPPGSDISNALNTETSTDVVIETDDGTIVEFFGAVSSGDLQVGDQVTFYGYPVGTAEVDNKMGGSFTHLLIVGNAIE